MHADRSLATTLESFLAREMCAYADAAATLAPGASWLPLAGGAAVFVSALSPVNAVAGLGMTGPVVAEDLSLAETFFRERGASRSIVTVCPLADPSLSRILAERGYAVRAFENQLVRRISPPASPPPPEPGIEILRCTSPADREEWGRVAARAFAAPLEPSAAENEIVRVTAARQDAILLLALVEGVPAATGELSIEGPVAWLSADATLPEHRRRGCQTALQRERAQIAAEAGCTLAASECAPGSGSQRNMERNGFRVVYTRVEMSLAL